MYTNTILVTPAPAAPEQNASLTPPELETFLAMRVRMYRFGGMEGLDGHRRWAACSTHLYGEYGDLTGEDCDSGALNLGNFEIRVRAVYQKCMQGKFRPYSSLAVSLRVKTQILRAFYHMYVYDLS